MIIEFLGESTGVRMGRMVPSGSFEIDFAERIVVHWHR